MRNSIFRDDEDDKEKAAAELAKKNKTKVDIKSINATTSKVDKKQARANAKRNAEETKAYNAEMYSSSKKMVIGIVLLITCPIWLAIVAVILGLFVAGAAAVLGAAFLGLASFGSSIASLLIAILSLLTAKIGVFVFALGCVFFLFAAGIGLWFLSYKLVTRIIPSGYFNVVVLFTAVKARLSRLALK
jgi:ABC-type multidrug transport system fused ATPase/permease subunit